MYKTLIVWETVHVYIYSFLIWTLYYAKLVFPMRLKLRKTTNAHELNKSEVIVNNTHTATHTL